jgi:transglutaminase-like putative cysteine protease
VLAVAVVVTSLAGWLLYPSTYRTVLPTRQTWNVAGAELTVVREEFADAVAPVPYSVGWALLAVIGVALVVFLGDTFAFRAHGRGEALVPGAVLFVFVAALGNDRARVPLTLLLVATGLIAVALLRARFAKIPRTTLGPSRHPLAATLPAAGMAAVVVVLGAWAIGPRLPGVGAEPLVDTSGRGGGGVTEVVSPLVDIRSRLVEQSATELFVMAAELPSNWRVSALPDFDGNTWGLPQRSLEDTRGELSEARAGSVPNAQALTVTALGGRLVPAAADPVGFDGEGVRFNDDTSTLVRTDRELEAGDVFTVSSMMPTFSPDQLRAAGSVAPPDPIYLTLPQDFPVSVREQAEAATASASNAYDRARTLQDWFRTNFSYSLEVPAGHSVAAIEAFLERRTGYCEQFAGTFAAMARALGIPARVAVGYTTGVVRPDGAYSVLGKNAHAWPEVWFDGYGWVPFEPTPGRGAPGAEPYTGVPPQQDDAPVEGAATAPTVEVAGPSTSVAAAVNGPDQADIPGVGIPDVAGPAAPTGSGGGPPWGALAVVVGLLIAVAATPAIARRVRRGHAAGDAAVRIAELWARARRAVESTTGTRLDPTLTPLEQARAAAPRLPVAAQPLRALAEVATAATYAPPGELLDAGIEAHDPHQGPLQWCHEIERAAADTLTPAGRVRRYFTDWR